MNEEAAAGGIDELCRHAADLIEAAAGPLKSVRVRSGELSVEVEWAQPVAVPAGGNAPEEDAPNGQALNGQAPNGQAGGMAAGPPPGTAPADEGTFVVHAPLVGTFYRSPSPDDPPFADVGTEVEAGQQVAIVEAMKMMNAVETERPGRVVEVLAADGKPVEYGEPLFVLAPVEVDASSPRRREGPHCSRRS